MGKGKVRHREQCRGKDTAGAMRVHVIAGWGRPQAGAAHRSAGRYRGNGLREEM